MKRYIALIIIALAAILMAPKATLAANERPGDLFKAPEWSAVYSVGNDGKRHVFPIEAVYKSWYGENWSLHKTLPLWEVSNWMLGRNIVYKPGTLVKIPSVPKVYLVKEVSADHDLAYIEWIPTEAEFLARGYKIRDIKDLPEPFFPGHYVELPNSNPQVNAQAADNGNDFDNDTIPDVIDNCPINPNRDQADRDSDRVGDVCDQYDNRLTPQTQLQPIVNVTIPPINIPAPQIIYVNQPPAPSDMDGDGLIDSQDNCPNIANSNQSDRDGDGIGDVCDVTDNRDTDGDGVLNVNDNCPNVANASQTDVDGDGIGDACDAQDNRPAPDADHDGLSDAEEARLGTNPNQADSDWDGLSDYDEVRIYHTNPNNPDTDGDGYSDSQEVATGHNPLVREACADACGANVPAPIQDQEPAPAPHPADADHDGLTDAEEARLGTNPNQADSDWDGLSDYQEVRVYNTEPLKPDTDGDGYADGYEVANGTDPNKAY